MWTSSCTPSTWRGTPFPASDSPRGLRPAQRRAGGHEAVCRWLAFMRERTITVEDFRAGGGVVTLEKNVPITPVRLSHVLAQSGVSTQESRG